MRNRMLRLAALTCSVISGIACFGACAGKQSYAEPNVKEGMKWEEKLPLMGFGEAAETIDYIDMRNFNEEVRLMITSLKAIVNANQPRIYTQESADNWSSELGLEINIVTDPFALVEKYKSEIKEVVIYDKSNNQTVNLACTHAGINESLVVSVMLDSVLKSKGLEFTVGKNFNGMFEDSLSVYRYLKDHYWNDCTHRAITSLNPTMVGYLRDYGMAIRSAIVWLDVKNAAEKALLEEFLRDMKAGESCYLGWFPEGNEADAISLSSEYGLLTFPSDYCENMTLMSSETARRAVEIPAAVAAPELADKVYVALCMSDGDNLQYLQHRMRALWNHPKFGTFPVSFTISPSSIVAQPAILASYYDKLNHNAVWNSNTAFMTGPSGIAYNYPRAWQNKGAIREVMALTNEYCVKAGVRVVNTWNDNTGWTQGMSREEVSMFANSLPDMLAVYDNAGIDLDTFGDYSMIENDVLIRGLDIPYSYVDNDNFKLFRGTIDANLRIFNAAQGAKPLFVALVANPWKNAAENGIDVYDELDQVVQYYKDNPNVEFVRIDHLAELEKEYLSAQAT